MKNETANHRSSLFWIVLAVTTIARVILAWRLEPCNDESYYYFWSLFPQLSYFDHPPLTAWAMAANSLLFGTGIWTIRLWPVIAGTLFVLAGRALGTGIFGREAGDRAGILLTLVPAFAGNGLLMTPDTLFALCWAAALFLTWKALGPSPRKWAWWAAAGLAVGFGFLSKYNMVLYFLSIGVLWLISPGRRRELFWGGALGGIIALAVFTPVIFWNWANDWSSFRFQMGHGFATREAGEPVLTTFPSYLGALLLIMTPVLALMACWSSGKAAVSKTFERRFLAVPFWCVVLFFTASSLRTSVEANWPMIAFFSGLIALAADWNSYARWLRTVAMGILILTFAGLFIGLAYLASPPGFVFRLHGRPVALPRMDEFLGGRDLARLVTERETENGTAFICVKRHQLIGRIAAFAPELGGRLWMPTEGRVRFPWIDDRQWTGLDALIVLRSTNQVHDLEPFFDTVQAVGTNSFMLKEAKKITIHFYRGNGYHPADSSVSDP